MLYVHTIYLYYRNAINLITTDYELTYLIRKGFYYSSKVNKNIYDYKMRS